MIDLERRGWLKNAIPSEMPAHILIGCDDIDVAFLVEAFSSYEEFNNHTNEECLPFLLNGVLPKRCMKDLLNWIYENKG